MEVAKCLSHCLLSIAIKEISCFLSISCLVGLGRKQLEEGKVSHYGAGEWTIISNVAAKEKWPVQSKAK